MKKINGRIYITSTGEFDESFFNESDFKKLWKFYESQRPYGVDPYDETSESRSNGASFVFKRKRENKIVSFFKRVWKKLLRNGRNFLTDSKNEKRDAPKLSDAIIQTGGRLTIKINSQRVREELSKLLGLKENEIHFFNLNIIRMVPSKLSEFDVFIAPSNFDRASMGIYYYYRQGLNKSATEIAIIKNE